MDEAPSFGRWLRQRRRALDLTQAELARRVGYSEVTIRKIEADELRPSKQIAERLADCLDLPAADRPAFLRFARGDTSVPLPVATTSPSTAAAPPSSTDPTTSTLTLLFTDIEGSTRLWQEQPLAMHAALARHDAILRQAIERHGGRVFKTVGDAFYAAFPTAAPALAAAVEAQRGLQTSPPAPPLAREGRRSEDGSPLPSPPSFAGKGDGGLGPLRVRMALASGAVNERDGDYFGPPLNRAARLLGIGHGGQILLAQATHELVRDTLPAEVSLLDLGERHLRDFERAERVYQVVAPDLPDDFPPLKSADRRPTNLVVPRDALIGREREVAAVEALLMRPDTGLVTLTGPGGTGKTRLALAVARRLAEDGLTQPSALGPHPSPQPSSLIAPRFPDGVFFVNLAPLSDPSLVVPTIAQTLDVREQGGQPILERLKDYLRGKQLLLVLDNFEQVVEAAPQVGEVLTHAPGVKALVTSRVPLHLRGERDVPVPPLGLPPRTEDRPTTDDRRPTTDYATRITQYEAVRLFIERATAVKPDFAVTNANAPAVAEICYRLDGLPLAIELAAARVRLLPPQALLARLDQRLKFLTGGSRDLPARQQTLRAAIDWSYTLLDEGEKTLFRRLAVFVGGFTLEAAEAVCNADGDLPLDVLDGVASLVDKSLVTQIRGDETEEGEPRFTMLETIREYALERLAESGEQARLFHAHAAYCLTQAEQAEPHFVALTADMDTWLARLQSDHDNLRAALRRAIEGGQTETALRLAGALAAFWHSMGYYIEGQRWLGAALGLPASDASPGYAAALAGEGMLAVFLGEVVTGAALLGEAIARLEAAGEQIHASRARQTLGLGLIRRAEYQSAIEVLEPALAVHRAVGDTAGTAHTLLWLGQAWVMLRDYTRAGVLLEECRALHRQRGSSRGAAMTLVSLGDWARGTQGNRAAVPYYQEALKHHRKDGHKWGVQNALLRLSKIALDEGDDAWLEALLREGSMVALELGDKYQGVIALIRWAHLWLKRGQPERAARLLAWAEAARASAGFQYSALGQADWSRLEAAVRAQLAEGATEGLWAEGRAMTMEQAVAYALEGTSDSG